MKVCFQKKYEEYFSQFRAVLIASFETQIHFADEDFLTLK